MWGSCPDGCCAHGGRLCLVTFRALVRDECAPWRMLLRIRVKVEIFPVVVVVVGGRVDKRTESAWMLGGGWVHGFHKWAGSGIRVWRMGQGEGVWGGVFLMAHRQVLIDRRESRTVCAERGENCVNRGL